jgi:hypothetical protein
MDRKILTRVVIGLLVVGLAVATGLGWWYYVKCNEDKKKVETTMRLTAARSMAMARAAAAAPKSSEAPVRMASFNTSGAKRGFPAGETKNHFKHYGNTIWDDDLPGDSEGPQALTSVGKPLSTRGALVHYSGPNLFNQAPDALDAKDIDVAKNAFPKEDLSKPKDGHEAVAQLYNFRNFRSAHDLNSATGYLQPIYQRQGWKKLGNRNDMVGWQQTMNVLKKEIAKSGDVDRLINDIFVPIPDQYLDFLYEAAAEQNISGNLGPELGISGRAAAKLHEKVERELRGSARPMARKVSQAEHAALIKDATQRIPKMAESGLRAMQGILKAHIMATDLGVDVPELDADQLRTISEFKYGGAAASNKAIANVIEQLQMISSEPLPPASFRP